jgi:hypothetical protein
MLETPLRRLLMPGSLVREFGLLKKALCWGCCCCIITIAGGGAPYIGGGGRFTINGAPVFAPRGMVTAICCPVGVVTMMFISLV